MKYFLIFFTCLVALLACSKKNPVENNPPQPDYFPVSTGSWWNYSCNAGSYTDSIGGIDTAWDGRQVYKSYHIGSFLDSSYYYKNQQGVWHYRTKDDTKPRWIMKHPLGIGDKWEEVKDSTVCIYDSLYVVTSGTISVPASVFTDCYQIKKVIERKKDGQKDQIIQFLWYAPNVGYVYESFVIDTIRLTQYSIK